MNRAVLPPRRYSESFEVVHNTRTYAVTVGCYPNGQIGEVFLGMSKAAGSAIDTMARDVAVLMSLCLQHGVTLETIAAATTKTAAGDPDGIAGAVASSLIAWGPLP